MVLFQFFELPLRSPFEFYLSRMGYAIGWYAFALTLALLFSRLRDIKRSSDPEPRTLWQSLLGFRDQYLTLETLLTDLRFLNVICLTFVIFIQLKHLTPILTHWESGVWDGALATSERQIFGGQFAGQALINILGTTQTTANVLSALYLGFFPYMAILLAIALMYRNRSEKENFFLGFSLVWLLGVLLIYALPSWGPRFYSPDTFASLPVTDVSELQERLWQNKLFVQSHPRSEKGIYLISGFPSLHLAVEIYGALFLRRISSWLAGVSWIFIGCTVITTLYFGWHYLIDDIAAAILAAGVYFAVGRRELNRRGHRGGREA